jgi:aconitate hydratase
MSKFEPEEFLNDRYKAIEERLAVVRKRLNSPLSLAEKVAGDLCAAGRVQHVASK